MAKALRLPITDVHAMARRNYAPLIGRDKEVATLRRIIMQQHHNNVVVIGRPGVGKTAFVHGLTAHCPLPLLEIAPSELLRRLDGSESQEAAIMTLHTAFASLPECGVIIDDTEALCRAVTSPWRLEQLFEPFIASGRRRLVLTMIPEAWRELRTQHAQLWRTFESITLSEVDEPATRAILTNAASQLATAYHVRMTPEVIDAVLEHSSQLPSERAMPDRALRLFEEACAACQAAGQPLLEATTIRRLMAQRLGLPDTALPDLSQRLAKKVIGQPDIVARVAVTIQSAWLGLKHPRRPFGSFLFLGPSGVGKTELAKVVAHEVYGSENALLRLDMSEFGEAHTVYRLIGAPPGYIGHEAGGQLTDFVRARPFSLILLDEIEKAHPSLFDIFLQLLDDGRLTDSHSRTVDFSKTIIMATSNLGSRDIIAGHDTLEALRPLLLQRFRPEFLNRFSATMIFRPLSPTVLLDIARLEITKLQQQWTDKHVAISVSDAWLQEQIDQTYDPLFGARPLKRRLEQTLEEQVAQQLLHTQP